LLQYNKQTLEEMKMKKSRSVKKTTKSKKSSLKLSRAALVILLGGLAAIAVAVISLAGVGSSSGVAAAANPKLTQVIQKRYKATRPIVVDKQTGQLRMPTGQELNEVVESLATLTKRSTEGLQQTSAASGGITIDLDGGFGGVMLARPNADGTWETKCVFTIEEGAEFLGLAEDNSPL
jgi:hypothetical protein